MYVFAVLSSLWLGAELTGIVNRQGLMLPNKIQPVGRDFVVFYSAGRIVASGDGDKLYDLARQHDEVDRIVGQASYPLPFAYPAYFALLYVPLSALPYLWAYAVAVAGMTGAMIGSVLLLRSAFPVVRQSPLVIILALLAYEPFVWQTFGGLNGGLALLCLSGALVALLRNRPWVAGVWLGLLLFKPQFSVPMLGLLAWRRQWRTIATATATGAGLTLAAAAFVSPAWPIRFLQLVLGNEYHASERACCGGNHVSLPAVAAFSFPRDLSSVVVIGLGVVALVLTLRAWQGEASLDEQFPLQFGLGLAVAIAWSPHALFYETSLLALPVLALLDVWGIGREASGTRLAGWQQALLACLMTGGLLWPLVRVVHVQPSAVLPVVVATVCWWELRQSRMAVVASSWMVGRAQ